MILVERILSPFGNGTSKKVMVCLGIHSLCERYQMVNSWLRAIGLYRGFFIVSFIPASTGLLMALRDGHPFSFLHFSLALLGIWAFHIGTNLINDYYDYIFRTDVINKVRTPFSGGTRVIIDGLLRAESVRNAAIASFVAGFIPLLILSYSIGLPVLLLAVAGCLSGYFYSAPPFKFAYRGLGELFIGLNFGPFILATPYFSQAQAISAGALIVSVVMGLFSAAIITVNEFPDYEADKETGKNNLIVRWGLNGGIRLYRFIVFSAFGFILLCIISGILPLISFLSIPLLFRVEAIARRLGCSPQNVNVMTASSAGTIQVFVLTWLILSAGLIYEIWKGMD